MKTPSLLSLDRLTREHGLYALAFGLALFVRFVRLGALPLSEFEAGWALQALGLGRGQALVIGPNPGYVALTGLLFALAGASEFLARFWPALAGSLLVFLPLAFRRRLGPFGALVAAFGLALDPGLTAVSRLAGGPALALSFSMLALAALARGRWGLAAVLGGLAVLGGPAFLHGALGLALAGLIFRLLSPAVGPAGHLKRALWQPRQLYRSERLGLFVLAGAAFFVGTMFFRFPQALSGLAAVLPAYLGGWTAASSTPALRLPLALLIYQPLALSFGIIGAVWAWQPAADPQQPLPPAQGFARLLSLWAAAALLLAVLYPGRQVSDLAWVLLPLWGLAALPLARLARLRAQPGTLPSAFGTMALALAALLVVLMAFVWLNLSGMSSATGEQSGFMRGTFLILMAASAGLAGVTVALVAMGWGWPTARLGIIWSLAAGMGVYMLAAGWSMAHEHPGGDRNLWGPVPAAGQAWLLQETLTDLSTWHMGQNYALEVVSLVEAPSVRWLLRDWPQVQFQPAIKPGQQPQAVITDLEYADTDFSAAYSGQDFAWQVYPDWSGVLPPALPRWLAFRQAPQRSQDIILWVRTDIFPGGDFIQAPAPAGPLDLEPQPSVPFE